MYRQSETNLHMSPQYGELRPTSGWDRFVSLGTPGNFNWFRVLAALLHGTLVVGVSQTAALNRGQGRAAITLGIGPHSSFVLKCTLVHTVHWMSPGQDLSSRLMAMSVAQRVMCKSNCPSYIMIILAVMIQEIRTILAAPKFKFYIYPGYVNKCLIGCNKIQNNKNTKTQM